MVGKEITLAVTAIHGGSIEVAQHNFMHYFHDNSRFKDKIR